MLLICYKAVSTDLVLFPGKHYHKYIRDSGCFI